MEELKNYALNLLCGVLCKNSCEVPFPVGYLAYVIQIVVAGMKSNSKSCIYAIMKSTKNIFSLNYRGLLGLIPVYIKKIKEVIKHSGYSAAAKSSAVSILASLLHIPDHYSNYTIVSFEDAAGKMPMSAVKKKVFKLIKYALDSLHLPEEAKNSVEMPMDKHRVKVISKAICCATILIGQEALKKQPDVSIIKVLLQTLT